MEPVEKMQMRIGELQQKLQENTPEYKTLLRQIHEEIRETPELAYALKDEEIAVIISGLSKFTGVVIAEKKMKEPISRKKAANITEDDV